MPTIPVTSLTQTPVVVAGGVGDPAPPPTNGTVVGQVAVAVLVDAVGDGLTPGQINPGFDYVVASPALQWVINHNLNRLVTTDAYTPGGQKIWADVHNVSLNQTLVTFLTPQAGYAVVN